MRALPTTTGLVKRSWLSVFSHSVLGGPLVVAPRHREGHGGAAVARHDHRLAVHHRRHPVGEVGAHERALPQQRAGGQVHADHLALRDGDELPRAAQLRDHRRAVARPVAVPAPAHVAGGGVERRQRALHVAADVEDDQRRRRRWARRSGWCTSAPVGAGLLPQLLAAGRVPRGHDAGHADAVEPAVGEDGRGLGAGAVPRRRRSAS